MRRMAVVLMVLIAVGGIAARPLAPLSLLHQSSVVLSDQQIRTLPSTPVIVVPSAGAGKRLIFQHATILKSPGFVSYQNIDQDVPFAAFFYAPQSYEYVSQFIGNIYGQSQQLNYMLGYGDIAFDVAPLSARTVANYGSVAVVTSGSASGDPLMFAIMDNASGDFDGGDPSNTLTISVTYYVLNLSTGQFE